MSDTKKFNERYDDAETQRRFDAALRGAFSTSPKPMKDIPRKRPKQKRKPKAKASASGRFFRQRKNRLAVKRKVDLVSISIRETLASAP